jgi:LytS/YehU family sensor histidine kinase
MSDFMIHLIGAFLANVVTYVVFYSLHTSTALQTSRLENEILEHAHLRAQLMSLQQQVSPHFLFNSLSTLKTLTREKPTKEFIVELATVYRYVLSFNQHYLTPLHEELSFVSSYLYIIKARYEESFHVTVSVSPEYLNLLVPPLSLQLLLENAIKHNVISPDRPLDITIKTDLSPSLIVTNTLQPKKNAEEGTGTGLNNIRERYRLLSGKTISVNDQHGYFTVTLPLLEP